MSFSNPWRIHLDPSTVVVVTVRSSMKALIGGCPIPDLLRGPLHYDSADLTRMFITSMKRVTELVHPMMIPTSNRCQSKDSGPAETLKLNLL